MFFMIKKDFGNIQQTGIILHNNKKEDLQDKLNTKKKEMVLVVMVIKIIKIKK